MRAGGGDGSMDCGMVEELLKVPALILQGCAARVL